MAKILAHFPLNVMILPGEKMRLHIFEPRYKQLITECLATEKTFGIPFVASSKLLNMGSEVKVTKLLTKFANGEMDIEIEGVSMFYLIDFEDPIAGKLYAGGQVERIENSDCSDDTQLINFFCSFYSSFNGKKLTNESLQNIRIFDIARWLNLNNQQKYELADLKSARSRQLYLVHQMRFLLLIKEQEKKLKNNFLLN
jgi:Lon protease-like protein